jgi:hypothetical protein
MHAFGRCLVFVACFAAHPARAHHSWTTDYDRSQIVRLEGEVRSFEFKNPHSFLHLDVEGVDGVRITWSIELHSDTVLTRMGFARDTFRVGDRVTVNAWSNRKPGERMVYGIGVLTRDGVPLGESPPERTP